MSDDISLQPRRWERWRQVISDDWKFFLALLAVALLGMAQIVWMTPFGIGVTPDSIMYLGTARGMVEHHAIAMASNDGWISPVVTYMPAIAACYAALMAVGIPLMAAAEITSVAWFGVTIMLVGVAIFAANGSRALALAATSLIALHPSVVINFTYAWSEVLFVPLIIGAILLAVTGTQTGFRRWLVAAGALLGAAYLTRYAAIAFIFGTALAVLVWSRKTWRERLIDAACVGGTAGLFIAAWITRNALLHGSAPLGRRAAWHGFPVRKLNRAGETLSEWIVPGLLSGRALFVAIGLALLVGGTVTWMLWRRWPGTTNAVVKPRLNLLPKYCLMVGVSYVLLLVATIFWFDPGVQFDVRIILPLLVLVIVGLLSLPQRRGAVALAMGMVTALLVIDVPGDWLMGLKFRKVGIGYTTPAYLNSPTLAAVRRLKVSRPLYSNCWDVVYFYTGRHAPLIPAAAPGSDPRAAVELLEATRQQNGVIVMLKPDLHTGLISLRQMQTLSPIRPLEEFADGGLYGWDERPRRKRSATTAATTQASVQHADDASAH